MSKVYIAGYEGIYFFNEMGEVYSERYSPPRLLKGGLDTKGYKQY